MLTRNGRWGIEQRDDAGHWAVCTVWCGHAERSQAENDHAVQRHPERFRVFDRNTGTGGQ